MTRRRTRFKIRSEATLEHHAGCRRALLLAAALTCGCDSSTQPSQNCQYSVSPAQFSPCMPATQFTASITTTAGCTWTAAAGAPWISIASGSSGSGPGTVTFSVTANYDAPRTGAVAVRGPNAATGPDVQVAQAGCLYSVSQAAIGFGAGGGSGSFDVITFASPNSCGGPLQDACIWTAQSTAPWITVTSGMPRSGDNPVNFTVDRNTSGAARTGTITVRDKVVQITQAG